MGRDICPDPNPEQELTTSAHHTSSLTAKLPLSMTETDNKMLKKKSCVDLTCHRASIMGHCENRAHGNFTNMHTYQRIQTSKHTHITCTSIAFRTSYEIIWFDIIEYIKHWFSFVYPLLFRSCLRKSVREDFLCDELLVQKVIEKMSQFLLKGAAFMSAFISKLLGWISYNPLPLWPQWFH